MVKIYDMSSVNLLFFSNNCEVSKQLISLMQKEGLIRFFHLVCTDNNSKIPSQITVTPTLLIRGIATPYVAGDAFMWLARVKQWKMNMLLQKVTSTQQQYFQNINNNLTNDNSKILGFNQAEMNSMSDIFSFFSKNIEHECQDPLPQSFVNVNELGNDNIYTVPLEDGTYRINNNAKYKLNSTKLKELQNKLEKERKQQDETFKQVVDNFKKQYTLR